MTQYTKIRMNPHVLNELCILIEHDKSKNDGFINEPQLRNNTSPLISETIPKPLTDYLQRILTQLYYIAFLLFSVWMVFVYR